MLRLCLFMSALGLVMPHVVQAQPGPGHRGAPAAHRGLHVPPGHRPPPGACRVWVPGRPPGHQPPPRLCHQLRHAALPPGARVLTHHGVQRAGRGPWQPRNWRVVFRRVFRGRALLSAGEIRLTLGVSIYRRIARLRYRGAPPLRGRWQPHRHGGFVLTVYMGDVPVARMMDRDGDRRAEAVALNAYLFDRPRRSGRAPTPRRRW
ncbi:hypothetical protein [Salisaeta longa]|uniref:hypothetical protein n=1 Tax=Salisaeta longa TaxID=503170 RepID=UPI0012FACC34|nr:hypothetical protein [Salisaeta longa]